MGMQLIIARSDLLQTCWNGVGSSLHLSAEHHIAFLVTQKTIHHTPNWQVCRSKQFEAPRGKVSSFLPTGKRKVEPQGGGTQRDGKAASLHLSIRAKRIHLNRQAASPTEIVRRLAYGQRQDETAILVRIYRIRLQGAGVIISRPIAPERVRPAISSCDAGVAKRHTAIRPHPTGNRNAVHRPGHL